MARIEALGEFFHFTNKRAKASERKRRSRSGGFGSLVAESIEKASSGQSALPAGLETEDLDELLDAVEAAGDSLKRRQGETTVRAYRSAVRAFLRYVLGRMYETERHTSRPSARRGVQKTYLLVRTVDQKLERLVADVLTSQLQQLDLLKRIEEINGLLVDLKG